MMRADVCAGLGFLGCSVDAEANAGAGDRVISPGSQPAVVVVYAREDLVMAREATALLEQGAGL
jgi:acetate kinase